MSIAQEDILEDIARSLKHIASMLERLAYPLCGVVPPAYAPPAYAPTPYYLPGNLRTPVCNASKLQNTVTGAQH